MKDLRRKNERLEDENAEVKKHAKRRVKNAAHRNMLYVRDLESDANQKIDDAANQRVDAVESNAKQQLDALGRDAHLRIQQLQRDNAQLKRLLGQQK